MRLSRLMIVVVVTMVHIVVGIDLGVVEGRTCGCLDIITIIDLGGGTKRSMATSRQVSRR